MDANILKKRVAEDNKVEDILIALGCHNVKRGKTCYTASNPDGDSQAAINVYHDTLNVLNHTRGDFPEKASIIDLVMYFKNLYFTHAIKWICDICGYSFYDTLYQQEIDEDPCLTILKEIEPNGGTETEPPLLLLDDCVLNEYVQFPNVWFLEDNIPLEVQKFFEIGFSVRDDCITIPIRDELGNLVGVKGRRTIESPTYPKYWFPYPVPKTKILYGLDKTFEHIKKEGKVFVFEAEKSVQKAYSMGYQNSVSLGGHELSDTQVLKLEKLGVDIILCLDEDIKGEELKKQVNKFLLRNKLFMIRPRKNKGILNEKEAPVDQGKEVFEKLLAEDLYKVDKYL